MCLLTAAIFGILAGATASRFRIASTNDMTRMLRAEPWGYHRIGACNETAKLNIKAIRTLRAGNTTKFRFLVLALLAQALDVLLLGTFGRHRHRRQPTHTACRHHRSAHLRRGGTAPHGELVFVEEAGRGVADVFEPLGD